MLGRRLAPVLTAILLVGACSPVGTPAPSSLAPGTYASKVFKPTVTFTIPTGWTTPDDSTALFDIVPAGSEVGGIYLFRDPPAASQDSTCPGSPAPGIMPRTSTALMAWIRGRPGLTVGTPALVTVGGLPGVEIDVSIKSGWANSCPFANGLPSVPLFALTGWKNPWTVAGSERLRLDLLDLPGGGVVVVDIDAFDASVFDSLVAAGTLIVKSMRFATG